MIWNHNFTMFALPEVISQHLLINLDLGPTLKCAPGHDSIEDSIIIKSYWLRSGVADSENFKIWIWAIWEWGVILFSYTMFGPCMRIQSSWDFLFWCSRKPWFGGQERLGTPERMVWPCMRIKISRKFQFSYTIWDPCTRINNSRNLLFNFDWKSMVLRSLRANIIWK